MVDLNNIFRDFATIFAIFLSGMLALLTVRLPNTRKDTLKAIRGNHPYLFWPTVAVALVFFAFFIATLATD